MKRAVIVRTDIASPLGTGQWLIRDTATDRYYVVARVRTKYAGLQVLAFRADAKGFVTSWSAVAGGCGMSREQALEDLEQHIQEGVSE